jgi:biopolymer transport protein ExbD
VLVVLAGASACNRIPGFEVCETAQLEAAVTKLEASAGDVAARKAALDSLRDACPQLNPTLWNMLANDYAGGAGAPAYEMITAVMRDKGFHRVRRHACPTIDDYSKRLSSGELTHDSLDVSAECNFARFGLYEGDEHYMDRDYAGVLLYDWMTSGGVSTDLARRFVRGIVQPGSEGDLPRSTADVSRESENVVSLDQTSLKLGDKVLLTLAGARIPDEARDGHVIKALAAELETASEQAQAVAEQRGTEWDKRLGLAFDSRAAFGDLVDVMFTGLKAGYRDYELFTANARNRRADGARIAISPPRMWVVSGWLSDEPRRFRPSTMEPTEVLVDVTGFRFASVGRPVETIGLTSDAEGCLARESALFGGERAGCYDYAALEAQAKALKKRQPHETVVTVRAAREIPLQIVVSAMDAARGRECHLLVAMHEEEVPEECYLWQTIVDTDPPLPLHPESWNRLTLRIEEVDPGGKGDLAQKRLRPRIEAALPAMSKCIVDAKRFRRAAVLSFFIVVRQDENGRTRVHALSLGPDAAQPTNDCIAAAIGLPNDGGFDHELKSQFVSVGFAVELPQ